MLFRSLIGLKENVIIGKQIPAGTGAKAERQTSNDVAELANFLREQRIERNKPEVDLIELPEEMIRGSEES